MYQLIINVCALLATAATADVNQDDDQDVDNAGGFSNWANDSTERMERRRQVIHVITDLYKYITRQCSLFFHGN